ncbi:hypothetical protein JMJ35_009751 [Cladonia borealis]|uniref:Uncharacterized protein n=1 Tax=Cladonia borealis TaxID=184061 RepID=A0AA39QRK0_9LECA|nr:hypothetical protein JMJ35_009751 [Cladonia borealis]
MVSEFGAKAKLTQRCLGIRMSIIAAPSFPNQSIKDDSTPFQQMDRPLTQNSDFFLYRGPPGRVSPPPPTTGVRLDRHCFVHMANYCKVFRFMSLPPEVRRLVYVECLVVGKVFPYTVSERCHEYDNLEDDEDTELELSGCKVPNVALLQVCKRIREEAEPMLYQQNIVVLPVCDLTRLFFKRSLHNDIRKSWVQSVELEFLAADLTRKDREVVLDEQIALAKDDLLFPEMRADRDFSNDLHEAYIDRLAQVVWPRKASYVLDNLALRKIHLNFERTTCNEDCCGMRGKAIEAMEAGFAKGMPVKVKLTGLGDASDGLGDAHRVTYRKVMAKWTSMRRQEDNPYDHVSGLEEVHQVVPYSLM